MKTKTTLKQIAKELEVSVSTVSKALSDSPEISEITKTKIKEFAALKNYKPNSIAKNLKNQRTNTLGVIIPNILNPFFAKVFIAFLIMCTSKSFKSTVTVLFSLEPCLNRTKSSSSLSNFKVVSLSLKFSIL